MKSMVIQKTGWLLEEKEDMHHSLQNKVLRLSSMDVFILVFRYHIIHFYSNRFPDSDLNIMPALGCWICPATSTCFAKCRQGKYKLQPAWASFGVRPASASQLVLLCTGGLITS